MPSHLFEQTAPAADGEYRFFQLGFVVDDVVGAAGRWAEVYGVGPFHVLPRIATEYVSRGTTSTIEIQVAVAQAGPVQIELIQQHDDTPSIFRDFAAVAGGGVGRAALHQLCTITADFDGKLAHYGRLGYEVAAGRAALHQLCTITADFDGKLAHYGRLGYEVAAELRNRVQRVAFVDTVDDFGFFTEVVEGPPEFLTQLAAIARTCAEWDGRDPVRLLTRDGYRTP